MTLETINQLTFIGIIILAVLAVVLGLVWFLLYLKGNKTTASKEKAAGSGSSVATAKAGKEIPKESVHRFMEFEKIEDNMIVVKDGVKYIMVVQCKGVNYDLMSEMEKLAVEEGFIQFLNTLRSRVQIYIQTRAVNLEDSINSYKQRTNSIEQSIEKNKLLQGQLERQGRAKKEDIDRIKYEKVKQQNLLEYGRDIINYTEKMSLNRNVLQKQYYIIIPYFASELKDESFEKSELKNIAFSELYTRAQAIIGSLAACGISSVILDSYDLVDLLYVAYNRDEAETFGLNKALLAGYDELYSTAEDVIEKKQRQLDEKIEKEALQLVGDVLDKVSEEMEQEGPRELTLEELIEERAKIILDQNEDIIGEEKKKRAKAKIDNVKKGEDVNGQETKTTKRATRTRTA